MVLVTEYYTGVTDTVTGRETAGGSTDSVERGRRDDTLGALLARSPDDPQRSRVVSVFELFSVCSLFDCLWANFLIHLLILLCYSSVSSVIYL